MYGQGGQYCSFKLKRGYKEGTYDNERPGLFLSPKAGRGDTKVQGTYKKSPI